MNLNEVDAQKPAMTLFTGSRKTHTAIKCNVHSDDKYKTLGTSGMSL